MSSQVPTGPIATARIQSTCPFNTCRHDPLWTSHTRVELTLLVAAQVPSGATASALIGLV
jgi:hypothetical protein